AEKTKEQAEVMRHQVAFYLDRARAAARATAIGSATEVKPVIESLTRTFEKVYRDRALAFSIDAPDDLRFRGEAQDLTDLIGNLLDNAGKWAHERIDIHAARDPRPDASGRPFFITQIDDDGPGLDPQARADALRRGKRLDESRPGSGLGLSIIVDLAHLYGGALLLEDSPLGGLRATLRLPAS
ncbi:MAG TPA: ATP-binding protein, partial [Roseiarcus sp.]|nr:ATP-binding protein [Roseiarcus sp.]